ncbi:MAG: PASTA domain-containing protein [Solirubrobacteraceae bacterium]
MSERTAVPERVSQRAKTAHRGGATGSQTVGDYVGQPAGEAAQAVRRAGLRPGLDRSFGCPPELIGLVVAQDPVAGSDLARNGMVTLYVAAPGGEPPDTDTNGAVSGESEPDGELAAEKPIEEEPSPPVVQEQARRRRKPRHGHRSPAGADTPPPRAAVKDVPGLESPALPVVEAQAQWPGEIDVPEGAVEDERTEELGEREFPREDAVVHVEDMLAGRGGFRGWHRVYPRRRRAMRGLGNGSRARAWLGGHRLAGALGLAVALWMVVGVASTLERHQPRTPPASALAPKPAPPTEHPGPAVKPPAAPAPSAPMTVTRSPRRVRRAPRVPRAVPPPRIPRSAPQPVRAVAPAISEAPAAAPARSEEPAPQPSEAPAPQASAPPAQAPEQQGGGPFSP